MEGENKANSASSIGIRLHRAVLGCAYKPRHSQKNYDTERKPSAAHHAVIVGDGCRRVNRARGKEGPGFWRRCRMVGKNPLGGEEVRQPPERQNPSIRRESAVGFPFLHKKPSPVREESGPAWVQSDCTPEHVPITWNFGENSVTIGIDDPKLRC